MPSDRLFELLAEAKERPSKAYRATRAAIDVPQQILEGVLSGSDIADKLNERKLANQTLEEALGGIANVPEEARGLKNLSVRQFRPTAQLLAGVGAITKAQKEKDQYVPRTMDGILANLVNSGKLTPDQAFSMKNKGMLAGRGYEEDGDGGLNPLPGGEPFRKIEEKKGARGRVTTNLKRLSSLYSTLRDEGGIVDTSKSGLANVPKRVASSPFGQAVGKAFGTKEQSLRNQINQIRPLLMNDIRQATEMGAKGLDSEKELEFYLQAATDPSQDIQTNLSALEVLDGAYGLGLGFGGGGSGSSGGKVKVSNGQETLEIDPNDIPEAIKDGYKPI